MFLGVTVPQIRSVAKKFQDLELSDLQKLLDSEIHEERLLSLIILVSKYRRADSVEKKAIYDFYLANTARVNNWDLVDLSAGYIVGGYLEGKNKGVLAKLAKSKNIWERRIAMISTFRYIVKGESEEALKIAKILIADKHDLIQKAVGWMLREVGKKCSQETEEVFLKKHYRQMPRTMLRYAIERFDEKLRKRYLNNMVY